MYGALLLFESEFVHIVAISFTSLILTELLMVALTIQTWHWLMIVGELLSLACYIASLVFLHEFIGEQTQIHVIVARMMFLDETLNTTSSFRSIHISCCCTMNDGMLGTKKVIDKLSWRALTCKKEMPKVLSVSSGLPGFICLSQLKVCLLNLTANKTIFPQI